MLSECESTVLSWPLFHSLQGNVNPDLFCSAKTAFVPRLPLDQRDSNGSCLCSPTHHICSYTPCVVLPCLAPTVGIKVNVCIWQADLLTQACKVLLSIFATRHSANKSKLSSWQQSTLNALTLQHVHLQLKCLGHSTPAILAMPAQHTCNSAWHTPACKSDTNTLRPTCGCEVCVNPCLRIALQFCLYVVFLPDSPLV